MKGEKPKSENENEYTENKQKNIRVGRTYTNEADPLLNKWDSVFYKEPLIK